MLDTAADRFQCRRDDIAAVGDGRSAEHDGEFGAGLEHLVKRTRDGFALMRYAPLGDNSGAAGASHSAVILSVFSMTLVASPGNSVDTTPTLRTR